MANKTLADAIAFNDANAATEMPYFFQEIFQFSEAMDTSGTNPGNNPQPIFSGLTYNQALAIDHNAGANGIDPAISHLHLDATPPPTHTPPSTPHLNLSPHFTL